MWELTGWVIEKDSMAGFFLCQETGQVEVEAEPYFLRDDWVSATSAGDRLTGDG